MDEPWDPVKARQNLRKHGVSFEEAVTLENDGHALATPDALHSREEKRFNVVGTSIKGRILHVTCTYRNGRMRPISARRASKRECHEYQYGPR